MHPPLHAFYDAKIEGFTLRYFFYCIKLLSLEIKNKLFCLYVFVDSLRQTRAQLLDLWLHIKASPYFFFISKYTKKILCPLF